MYGILLLSWILAHVFSSGNLGHVLPVRVDVAVAQNSGKPSLSETMKNGHRIQTANTTNARRRDFVLKMIHHAWDSYERRAMGFDEIRPMNGLGVNNWGGVALTLIDSLDTLILAGMEAEFRRAVEWLRRNPSIFDTPVTVNVFETAIRHLGGLVGAYELRPDPTLRQLAEDMGQRLIRAFFHCGDSAEGCYFHVPFSDINLRTFEKLNGAGITSIAEVSLGMELKALARVTRNCSYAVAATTVTRTLRDKLDLDMAGMAMNLIIETGDYAIVDNNKVALGARGDSYYEYLLKEWILTGRRDSDLRHLYDTFYYVFVDNLLFNSSTKFAYVGELRNRNCKASMDHLVCFLPGVLALDLMTPGRPTKCPARPKRGRWKNRLPYKRSQRLEVAKKLMNTCVEMYTRMDTGLAPEISSFDGNGLLDVPSAMHSILRPETVESLYLMWHLTRDSRYRDAGWRIALALERNAKVQFGYSGLDNVRVHQSFNNQTPSFFFAETLKYLYLLYVDGDRPNEFVFSTEAHPFRIFDGFQFICGLTGTGRWRSHRHVRNWLQKNAKKPA